MQSMHTMHLLDHKESVGNKMSQSLSALLFFAIDFLIVLELEVLDFRVGYSIIELFLVLYYIQLA